MLTLLSTEKSKRLLECFAESEYTEANVKKQLGAAELPSRRLRNLARLKYRTSDPTILNALLRWFWLGLPQNRAEIVDLVPEEFLDLLLESGLIVAEGERFTATAMVLPEDGFLVASDHPAAFEQQMYWQFGVDSVRDVARQCEREGLSIETPMTLQTWGEWVLVLRSPGGYRIAFEGPE